jgi:hypothetical protein
MNTATLIIASATACFTLCLLLLFIVLFAYLYVNLSHNKDTFSAIDKNMRALVEGMSNTQELTTDLGKALLDFTKYYRSSVNRYQHSNGMFAWYVSMAITSIAEENKMTFAETVLVTDNKHFVPSIVSGVMRRRFECESLAILGWHSLTEDEFKQDASARTQLTNSDFN